MVKFFKVKMKMGIEVFVKLNSYNYKDYKIYEKYIYVLFFIRWGNVFS